MTAPLLVFGWGNPSRGDDALGPLFVARLRESLAPVRADRVECLDDFQLQIEHALDLVGRQRVLFVDASLDGAAPFEVSDIAAVGTARIDSHALSPQALLQVYGLVHGSPAPRSTLLAIRGRRFELGEPLSDEADRHLELALAWARHWIDSA